MKTVSTLLFITSTLIYAGLFGDTKEEQRIGKENLTKAIMGKQDPRIQTISRENEYLKKILRKHHIDYKTIINAKKRAHQIKNITNRLTTPEAEQVKALQQINKELIRLLEVNYIDYKLPKRDPKITKEKHKKQKLNIIITEQ